MTPTLIMPEWGSRMKTITEKTLVPIGLVIIGMGGVVWLTTLHNLSVSNEKAIERIEKKQDEYNKNLGVILEKLANIQGKLGIPNGPGT